MFSNQQQQNTSDSTLQVTSSLSQVLPSPPPAISINSISVNGNNSSSGSIVTTSILALDGLNCGGIPTRTTPTLTPTLRNFEADILTHGSSEDFAVAAASDLHHLVSSSCSSINVPSSDNIDQLSSNVQSRPNVQNLSIQHISLQNINTQNIIINNMSNHQHMNQNTLNQQQQNEYNNSFSLAPSRQAGFVPPLVLQINSSNNSAQQQSGATVLLNSSNGSIFNTKSLSTLTSSSHWQGAVVTQRPLQQRRKGIKRQFTDDDEDGDEDFDSGADEVTDDSSDTTSGKMTRKSKAKNNKSSLKTTIKSEFNDTNTISNASRGRANKNNKVMSAEEEKRRQIRRERNKMAAARCRKRRMDHTNELLEETEQLEDKRLQLQVQLESLHLEKTNLQQMIAQHKCVLNKNNRPVSCTVSSVNHNTTILDSTNAISESSTSVLNIDSTSSNRNLQQQTGIKNENNAVNNVLIKCEEPINEDTKNNIIPISVMQHISKRRPTTLSDLNSGSYGNCKKIDSNGGVVVLNFESLMEGGTGLTPISASVGSVQSQQHSNTNSNNNNVLS